MKVTVEKLTNSELAREACSCTANMAVNPSLWKIYASEHSPARTQVFKIVLNGIPSFVSTHFVRHSVGVSHYVQSNREDRAGVRNEDINRLTPVNHIMLANAQALINMSHLRLCSNASAETREVMFAIREAVKPVDPDLYDFLEPMCDYRGGYCWEFATCKKAPRHPKWLIKASQKS